MAHDPRLTGVFVGREVERLVKAQQEAEGLTMRQKAEQDVMVYLRLTQQQKKAEQDGAEVCHDRRDFG